jgi:hypothetical protein
MATHWDGETNSKGKSTILNYNNPMVSVLIDSNAIVLKYFFTRLKKNTQISSVRCASDTATGVQ